MPSSASKKRAARPPHSPPASPLPASVPPHPRGAEAVDAVRAGRGRRGRPGELRRLSGSFFFNETATTEIYTLSLHDALPIYEENVELKQKTAYEIIGAGVQRSLRTSEEHTSELQSHDNCVSAFLCHKKY